MKSKIKILEHLERLNKDQIKDLLLQKNHDLERMNQILDGIGLSILVFDLEGKVIHFNRAMARFLRRRKSQILSKKAKELFVNQSIRDIFDKVMIDKEKVSGEEIILENEDFQMGRVQVFPVADEGKIDQYVFILENVTEERTKELKNLHQKSIRSLAALTAGVAHEIRNPLGSLDLHMQLIQRFIKDAKFKNKQNLMELTGVVEEEIKRLDKIVSDFLFSVRPIRARKKPEDPNAIAEEIYKLMLPKMSEEGIVFDLHLSKENRPYPMDKDHIKQALINLITNAKNAQDESKETHRIKLNVEWEKSHLVFSIEDNGMGIGVEMQRKIFDPFYTSRKEGTGLGLTIVYKIVSEHGGEIVLSSMLNKGSLFRIELPLRSNRFLTMHEETQHNVDLNEE